MRSSSTRGTVAPDPKLAPMTALVHGPSARRTTQVNVDAQHVCPLGVRPGLRVRPRFRTLAGQMTLSKRTKLSRFGPCVNDMIDRPCVATIAADAPFDVPNLHMHCDALTSSKSTPGQFRRVPRRVNGVVSVDTPVFAARSVPDGPGTSRGVRPRVDSAVPTERAR